jgi:hypothetical protein
VTLGDANAAETTATFQQAGTYVLRLTASDGALSAVDDLTVNVSSGADPDVIFADGFESGDFSAWSAATTGGSDLSVSAAATLSGSWGMQALIDDNGPLFVTTSSPANEPRYRARFHFHPNGVSMATNDTHVIFDGKSASGATVVRVEFRWNGKKRQIRAGTAKDGTAFQSTAWRPITNAWHPIELDWRASTSAGANNGTLTLWIDGAQVATLAGVDNDTRRVDSARLGAVDGIDTATRGTTYFDEFQSRRLTYIGP